MTHNEVIQTIKKHGPKTMTIKEYVDEDGHDIIKVRLIIGEARVSFNVLPLLDIICPVLATYRNVACQNFLSPINRLTRGNLIDTIIAADTFCNFKQYDED